MDIDWISYVGKEFSGRKVGRYRITKHETYEGRNESWKGKKVLIMESLSSRERVKFPIFIDVLVSMQENFVPKSRMDKDFYDFCVNYKIPHLPGQFTGESYYISFYETFLQRNR